MSLAAAIVLVPLMVRARGLLRAVVSPLLLFWSSANSASASSTSRFFGERGKRFKNSS